MSELSMYHRLVARTKRTRPEFVIPMAAQAVQQLPEGPEWLYELKLDAYRALVIKDKDSVAIQSRNAKDLTRMYPGIVAAARRLKLAQVVMDGELVALDEHGVPFSRRCNIPASIRASDRVLHV